MGPKSSVGSAVSSTGTSVPVDGTAPGTMLGPTAVTDGSGEAGGTDADADGGGGGGEAIAVTDGSAPVLCVAGVGAAATDAFGLTEAAGFGDSATGAGVTMGVVVGGLTKMAPPLTSATSFGKQTPCAPPTDTHLPAAQSAERSHFAPLPLGTQRQESDSPLQRDDFFDVSERQKRPDEQSRGFLQVSPRLRSPTACQTGGASPVGGGTGGGTSVIEKSTSLTATASTDMHDEAVVTVRAHSSPVAHSAAAVQYCGVIGEQAHTVTALGGHAVSVGDEVSKHWRGATQLVFVSQRSSVRPIACVCEACSRRSAVVVSTVDNIVGGCVSVQVGG